MCVSLHPLSTGKHLKFIDNTERDNEVKKLKEIIVCNLIESFFEVEYRDYNFRQRVKLYETLLSRI